MRPPSGLDRATWQTVFESCQLKRRNPAVIAGFVCGEPALTAAGRRGRPAGNGRRTHRESPLPLANPAPASLALPPLPPLAKRLTEEKGRVIVSKRNSLQGESASSPLSSHESH